MSLNPKYIYEEKLALICKNLQKFQRNLMESHHF